MNNVFLLLTIIGIIGVPVCLILAVIRLLKKQKAKPTLVLCAVFTCICIFSFIGFGLTIPPKTATVVSSQETQETTVVAEHTFEETSEKTSETIPEETKPTPTEASTESLVPTVESVAPLSPKEEFAKQLTANPNVTADAANSTFDILTSGMGFENIIVNKNPTGTLFEVKADDYNLKVTVSDKLYMVICGDYNLYKDDSINYTKNDLEDRKIGKNDSKYYAIAMEAVSANLKNPSSAQFSSMRECKMARKGEYVAVQGYVIAVNSFGAQTKNDFLVEFRVIDLDTYSYETVYLNIAGETSGTYIDLK